MATPSSALVAFVTRMSKEPEFVAEFDADSTGVMTAAGLSPEEQELVRNRDLEQVTAALEGSGNIVWEATGYAAMWQSTGYAPTWQASGLPDPDAVGE